MLCELQIQNIAIIKEAVISFEKGFNVMTGETGAGKSIVIDSINAVLGERTSRELIRTGCDSAFVSALFYENSAHIQSILQALGLPQEDDGAVLIQRKLFADGRNSCKINGVTVTVSSIRQLAKHLVSIHGQLDNQTLLSPEYHCAYIDSLAEDAPLIDAYAAAYQAYLDAEKKLAACNLDETDKLRRLDILNYQIDELESAAVVDGEMAQLEERLAVLQNAERITELLQAAYGSLSGDDEAKGAAALAFDAVQRLEEICRYSEEYASMKEGIREAAYTLSAYCDELRDRLFSEDFDPALVNTLEERLDVLHTLQKKYGDSEAQMLAYLEAARAERDRIEMSDEVRAQLTEVVLQARETALQRAQALREARNSAAEVFCRNVCSALAFLDMPSVRFFVRNTPGDLTENGIDNIEFILSANAGEEPKPLAKIASGGELSRIMLAIKGVLAEKDNIGTLIFDEVDTGVSGRAAQKIAIQLQKLSQSHQVICVTHLAQIAAFADIHMRIEKSERDGKTFTDVTALDFIGRKHELARILGGMTVTELQLKSAEEMLHAAQMEKTVDKT